ncbi:MAG: M12 family metallo-peptidase [Acidobacteriota bacterium]
MRIVLPSSRHRITGSCRALIALFTLAALALGAPAASAADSLFLLQKRVAESANLAQFIPDAAEHHRIAIDPQAIAANPEEVSFTTPDGRRWTAVRDHFEVYEDDWKVWAGTARLDGGFGAEEASGFVQLNYHGSFATAVLNLDREQYQIAFDAAAPTKSASQSLVRLNRRTVEQSCGVPKAEETAELSRNALRQRATLFEELDLQRRASEVDAANPKKLIFVGVLAVYPSYYAAGSAAETQVRTFIQDSVALANTIFANSGVFARYHLTMVRLTGHQPVAAGGAYSAVQWLDSHRAAYVRNMRSSTNGDFVAIFTPPEWRTESFCGIAYLPEANGLVRGFGGAFRKRAFSAHRVGCGLNDYTFAHELGHNMGMRHDIEDTSSTHKFPYGRGRVYNIGSNEVATVMGCADVDSQCLAVGDIFGAVCDRETHFSDWSILNFSRSAPPAKACPPVDVLPRQNKAVANAQYLTYSNFY